MSGNTCTFCESSSKYVCPRCGVPYCSVVCYRSSQHQRCSEGFYRDCVQQQLRAEHAEPVLRRRTEEALARQARLQAAEERGEPAEPESDQPDSDDSDSDEELAERLRGVDLDNSEAVWARLTATERDEFRRQASAGAIAAEPWRPWWTRRAERPKVAELGAEVAPEFVTAAPPLLTHVPPLTALSRQPPSPLLVNSVINVLYAYAQLRLQWDGDWSGAVLPAADALRRLSGCLARGEVMQTAHDAVDAVDLCLCQGAEADAALRRQSRRAVQQLLAGPCVSDAGWYVLAALSDLWRLLDSARTELQGGRHRVPPEPADSFGREFGSTAAAAPSETAVTRDQLRRMQRKLEYLFAWSKSHEAVLSERAGGPRLETEVLLPSAGSSSSDGLADPALTAGRQSI